jgi:hypothetical protein
MESLKLRGFNEKWCGCIAQVVTGGTVSVKINDQLGPYFRSYNGVRQGDPLSPILFNFVVDCLTKMVKRAQKNKLVTDLADNLVENEVVILQYADDTILCFKKDMTGATNLKLLLYFYELMSGLKINFSKSEVVVVNGNDEIANRSVHIFNCQVGQFPIKYLGVL